MELVSLIWAPKGPITEKVEARMVRAVELFESLAPGDGVEGMLATQMVGTHLAALECLRLASQPGQTYENMNIALKNAQKLMTLYTQQLAALNKHRGKGQQKVTVEHVHVEAGGQAIVGNVEAGPRRRSMKADTRAALAEGNDVQLDLTQSRQAARKA